MGKGAYAASEKGVFLNKKRLVMYRLICDNKHMSLDELCDYFSKAEDKDIRINDKKNVRYHLEILMMANYISEETIYRRKIYRKTWFSSKNM